ncbi:MAG: TIGR03619 family F420-dependent LLM class oxidoreductase [Acidobacteriaceae bacterium]|nr:TIGR03619 family F420-dependent LLM class oxidoreductase [Acidobacteriaceae bacterium]
MEFGIAMPQSFPDPARIQSFLRRAEELPFAAVWCIEQVIGTAPVLESVTTLAYAAALTKRLRLGVAVLIIPQRNPVELAKTLSTVDVLSNGRLIVGVGLGGSTRHYPAYGLATEGRVSRFRENLEIIKRLWTEDRATFPGRFAQLDNVPMEPKPMQKPRPPIWFGGHAEAALKRAVELGDGFIGAGSTPTAVFLEDIKQLPATFPKAKRLYLALGDNLPRLREWFGAFYHKPEMADQVAVWGSPQHIADEIRRLKDAGVNHVLLNPVFDEEVQMQRLADEVLPQI